MKKTCVFIIGTNAVGKSTLAWSIIERQGGIKVIEGDVTYLNGGYCLAGKYGLTKFGGVDRILNEKGSSCTSRLGEVVETALEKSDVIFCEGRYMNTFGKNMTNAMFKAQKHLVVFLYADKEIIYNRCVSRSNGKKKNGLRNWRSMFKAQECAFKAAEKWHSIGVNVIAINTGTTTIESEVEQILNAIKQ